MTLMLGSCARVICCSGGDGNDRESKVVCEDKGTIDCREKDIT